MKLLKTKTKKMRIELENAGTWITGEVDVYEDVEVIDKFIVELSSYEYEKLKHILALSEKQYQKFLKKFRN